MNALNFARVRDRELSLWQSAVAEYLRGELKKNNQPAAMRDLLDHPLSIATADYVTRKFNDPTYQPPASFKGDTSHEALVFRSHLGHQIGEALATNDMERYEALSVAYRKFCDEDYSIGPPPTGFATCPITYAQYALSSGGRMTYNDWTTAGGNNINYGVINWKLPNNAKVGILGDWGTGMPDAIALLKDMMVQHKPDVIIHLGDIYYSGTPQECDTYFRDVFTTVFNEVLGPGKRIPVFSIPGNHDYYAWGAEYYNVVTNLNNNIPGATQQASYFCLRTQDNGWQFLGMDTGYNDSNPANQLNTTYAGPWLQPNEITWHQDKLANFPGLTILLSHHQLYSSNSKINGSFSVMNAVPYYNPYLYRAVGEYLPTKVAGWIWGHEHNFVMYRDYLAQLPIGRLVGNSAYEELTSANPYQVNYPQIPYVMPEPQYDQYKLGINQDSNGVQYYNHGYAIIDLSGRKNPTDPVQANYYQFPAWGSTPPPNPVSTQLYQEPFSKPQPFEYGDQVHSGGNHMLSNMDGMDVQDFYAGSFGYNYPVAAPGMVDYARRHTIRKYVNGHPAPDGTPLISGDVVSIQTTQNGQYLTAGTTPWLYYASAVNNNSLWVIKKKEQGSAGINIGDAIYLENVAYTGQYLKPVYAVKWSMIYLTTEVGADYWWRFCTME
ncbi:metallophosphoesterase family protein [Terrimonas ferruginea]|uniref:metallophosphoesterase family protein n=1 Tax=Terrimonas ferruginea TaxID=249 RepID=UPI00040738F4|nr:metallophosphoesterase [Terrimonas ferruginea]